MGVGNLRPNGQMPFMVRRVRSLPIGYHERTKGPMPCMVRRVRSLPVGNHERTE